MIDLPFDQVPDGVGHASQRSVDLAVSGEPDRRTDQACADQVVDGVDHEERVALRPIVDECRQLSRQTMRGKPHRQVFRNRLLVQVLEGQLCTLLLGSQLLFDGLQRMPARDELCRPVSTDDHQPRFASLPRHVRDQVQRRVVAPVQIFQHEHQRRFSREGVKRVAHLSQHPLARGPEDIAPERLPILRPHARWQLQQPHRRVGPQHIDHERMLPAELSIASRTGRYASPVPYCSGIGRWHPHIAIARHAAHERIEQRRLPDARFTADEDNLPLARAHLLEPRLHARQRALASDDAATDGRQIRHRGTPRLNHRVARDAVPAPTRPMKR